MATPTQGPMCRATLTANRQPITSFLPHEPTAPTRAKECGGNSGCSNSLAPRTGRSGAITLHCHPGRSDRA